MVNCFSKIFTSLLLFFYLCLSANAAQIMASVDHNPIASGESFQFILTAIGSIDKNPDFIEIQNKFTVLNTSKSSSVSFSSALGTESKVTWTMQLLIDKPGEYIIPSIKLGKDKSSPVAITVLKNKIKTDNAKSAEIYFEVDVEPKSVYVQQQIIYTFRIFRRVNIVNDGFSSFATENNQAIVTKIGKVSEKNVMINGVAHIVSEYKYAIFPQNSGTLKILPLIYEAQFAVGGSRQRSFYNILSPQTTTKRIRSKIIEIEVKGIPSEFTTKYPNAAWLPVDDLTISESWSNDVNSFKSGEPATRTINLTVQNLSAVQLPDVKIDATSNIKIYPDVPTVTEKFNNKGLIATKLSKVAILPTVPGKHKLSKIIIPWWNTRTNTIQESSLPAFTFNVGAALNQADDHPLNLNNDVVIQKSKSTIIDDSSKSDLELVKSIQETSNSSFSWIIISSILAVLWLITVYLLVSLRKKLNAIDSPHEKSVLKPVSTKKLKAACLDNNAHACSKLIVQWANNKAQTERFTNLSSLLPYTDQNFAQAILELEQCLYSNNAKDWNGTKIWSAFDTNPPDFSLAERNNTSVSSLPSLYAKYK